MTRRTPASRPLRAAVSGSFKRHLAAIQGDVERLTAKGVEVLSPADPRIVDRFGDFVFVSSDIRRSIKGVQNRHLAAIHDCDFLWLVCPDGYVGQSAAMELGFAVANAIPVYSDVAPLDWTLRQYVRPVGTVEVACDLALGETIGKPETQATLLVAPQAALEGIRAELEAVERSLLVDRHPRADDPVERSVRKIRGMLVVPTER